MGVAEEGRENRESRISLAQASNRSNGLIADSDSLVGQSAAAVEILGLQIRSQPEVRLREAKTNNPVSVEML